MELIKLDESIMENLDGLLLKTDEIKHLIGICRSDEGRDFLMKKIGDAQTYLINMRSSIVRQFGITLCDLQKNKDKVRKVYGYAPELSKQQIAEIVGCSLRHVERVLKNV